MFDIDSIKEIKILKQSERQKVFLMEAPDGKRYLKREISGDKREIYKTLKKINHESIPKIYYVGFDSDTIVIEEYIEGISLSDYMSQNKELSKKQVYSISNQLLSALDKLHESDIIHRDIKPENILVDESNHIWLTDYDIARIYRKEVRRDTETMGTFGYAPIEQYGMLPTDFKTDIYAFGVTLKTLLDYANIKGFLYKVAEKCKRLDPSQRYKSAKEVKRAITLNSLKYPLIFTLSAIVLIVFLIYTLPSEKGIEVKTEYEDTKKIEQNAETDTSESEVENESETEVEKNSIASEKPKKKEEKKQTVDEFTFEGTFYGFAEGPKESEYRKQSSFSNVCIFSLQQPWEHIFLLEDINKKGKIKIGKNNTVVDADMTLNNGKLSVSLDDGKGHTYSSQFSFNNQYEYTKHYTNDLRKNADIICYDFDGDGGTELLIGLNEGAIGIAGKQVYNNFNYCMAWCISYDETTGFTLCEGDMFSKGYAFWMNDDIRKLNVSWEDIGDVTGYFLENKKIIPS